MAQQGRSSDRRITCIPNTGGLRTLTSLDAANRSVEVYVWWEATSLMVGWETPPNFPVQGAWKVERSPSPFGPWYPVGNPLLPSARRLRDDDAPQDRRNTRYLFYRVGLEIQEGQWEWYGCVPEWEHPGESTVGGVTWGKLGVPAHKTPAVVREIRRRELTVLRTHTGTPALVYRPDWLSDYNPAVVSTLTGTYRGDFRTSSSLGSPRQNAYCTPFLVWINLGPSAQGVNVQEGNVTDLTLRSITCPYWPALQFFDKLRLLDGRLFEIGESIVPHEHYEFVTTLTCTAAEIEPNDPLCKLPMPEWFREEAQTPRRQYSRATTLEGYNLSRQKGAQSRASILPGTDAGSSDR